MIRHFLFAALLLLPMASIRMQAGESLSASGQTAAEIEDIGLIEPVTEDETAGKFRASVTLNNSYTSNAELTGIHDSGDYLFLPSIELGYHKPLSSQFSFDIAAKLEAALYAKYDERAFIGYSIVSTLDWRPTPASPRIYIGVEPYRYDSFDTGDRISQAIGLSVGTDWGYAFNQGASLAFVGYSFTDYLADPTADSRTQNKFVAGVTHQFRPQLYGQLLYAYSYSDFINADRHDSKHLLGLNLIYQISTEFFTTLSGNWVTNDSDALKASYESAGGSLGFTLTF